MWANNKVLTVLMMLISGIILLPQNVLADFYRYVNDKGIVCMTNKLEAVPQKYRASMKVIPEEKKIQPPVAPDPSTATVEPAESRQPMPAPAPEPSGLNRLTAGRKWAMPVLLLVGATAAFLLIKKLVSLLSSPQLARVIYLAFFAGIFVFCYKYYAGYIVDNYFAVKTKVIKMFIKANERRAPETGEKLPGDVKGESK